MAWPLIHWLLAAGFVQTSAVDATGASAQRDLKGSVSGRVADGTKGSLEGLDHGSGTMHT